MDIYEDLDYIMWVNVGLVIVMLVTVGVFAYYTFGFTVAVYSVATATLVNVVPTLVVEHLLKKAGFEEKLKGGKSE